MTDAHPHPTQDSCRSLRQQFIAIAELAAEQSESERCEIASVMVDLLSVASLFCDDSSTTERGQEIVQYANDRALPTLMADDAGHALNDLANHIQSHWGDCLNLLEPGERYHCQVDDAWQATDGHACVEAMEDEDSPVSGGLDISDIMASLARDEAVSEKIFSQPELASEQHEPADTAGLPQKISTVPESVAPPATLPARPTEVENIDDPEMVAAFGDDAQLCLSEMEASVLGLESDGDTAEGLRNFCRQLHTLKGASGTVGLTRLAGYLHDLESYVEANSDKGVDVDRLLEGVDAVQAQLVALGICNSSMGAGTETGFSQTSSAEPSAVQSSSQPMPTSPASAKPSAPSGDNELFVRVEASRLERLMDLLAELVMLRNRRDTYVDSLQSLNEELTQCSSRTRALTSMADMAAPMAFGVDSSVMLSANAEAFNRQSARGRLLGRSLDELSKDTAELGRTLLEVCEPLSNDNAAVSHLIGRFRQELMELRRQPIGGLFQRLQRAVRDAAKAEGKRVEIQFEGRGARADRGVQERLYEPLLHLVRNAVSHGIQSPDVREGQGKTAAGKITLAGWSDASSLWIEVRDDGQGLDTEKIAARGRELGLITHKEAGNQTLVWKLIFHPGFSTSSSVSEISGRGVGMDVVDSWVRRLRGRIDVESEPGQGTTFRLQIPLRSAVEHAMIVRSGGQLFALPMHTVSGTSDARVPMSGLPDVPTTKNAAPLSSLIGCHQEQSSRRCYVSLKRSQRTDAEHVESHDEDVTISVEGIVGVEEVVVRTLPPLLQRNELFAGVTLSGGGETVLLLDVTRVLELNRCNEKAGSTETCPQEFTTPGSQPEEARQNVLVVDDSVVVRRMLDRRLTEAGFNVYAAANGRAALDILKASQISAVVTDLDMPIMNGIELCQEIHRLDQFKDLPITVLSSRDRHSLPAQIHEFGLTSILSKPVNDSTIALIVDSLQAVPCS